MDRERRREELGAPQPVAGSPPPDDAAAATTGASVAIGSAWNFAVSAVPQLYLILVSIAAARFLGPDLFGRQSFIAFIQISLVMLLTGGMAFALSRFVALSLGEHRPGAVAGLMRYGWRVAIPAAALGGGVLLVIALLGADPAPAWMLAGAATLFNTLTLAPQGVLTGFQRWRGLAVIGLVTGAGSTAAVIAVLAAGGGIIGIFAVQAGAAAWAFAWTATLNRRTLASIAEQGREEKPPIREMLRFAGVATAGVVLTLIVWRRSEFLFLDAYSTDAQIGFYSLAFAAVTALTYAPAAVAGTFVPAIATLHGAGAIERIRSGYARALRLVLAMALPLAAGAAALGPPLIRLVYGEDFTDAGTVFLVLLAPFPLIALMGLSTSVLEAMGHLRIPFLSGLVAALVNIGLDFALIPRYDATGAAVANATAQVIAGLPPFVYAHRFVGGVRWRVGFVARVVLAAGGGGIAAVGCVIAIGGILGVIAGAVAGLCVFALIAGVTGMLPGEDAAWLDATIGGLLGGRVGRVVRFWAQPAHEGPPLP
jgi:O-antigen/teichoic acid export membrane protein